MKEYTVREVAEMLSTNEETVRRWIRDGKLASSFTSKKTGHRIAEDKLTEFLKNYPRYNQGIATASLWGSGIGAVLGTVGVAGAPIIGGALAGTLSLFHVMNQAKQRNDEELKQQATVNAEQMTAFLRQQIMECEAKIQESEKYSVLLEKQLNATNAEITGLRSQIESFKAQLEIWTNMKEEV